MLLLPSFLFCNTSVVSAAPSVDGQPFSSTWTNGKPMNEMLLVGTGNSSATIWRPPAQAEGLATPFFCVTLLFSTGFFVCHCFFFHPFPVPNRRTPTAQSAPSDAGAASRWAVTSSVDVRTLLFSMGPTRHFESNSRTTLGVFFVPHRFEVGSLVSPRDTNQPNLKKAISVTGSAYHQILSTLVFLRAYT